MQLGTFSIACVSREAWDNSHASAREKEMVGSKEKPTIVFFHAVLPSKYGDETALPYNIISNGICIVGAVFVMTFM